MILQDFLSSRIELVHYAIVDGTRETLDELLGLMEMRTSL